MKEQLSSGSLIFRLLLWLSVMVFVSITVFALISDFRSVSELLTAISPGWIAVISGCVVFNYILRFIKWRYFLRQIDVTVPLKTDLWVFFSAFTMVLSPAKLGELVKSFLLKARMGIPVAKTAPVIMAERLTDLAGLVILCLIGFSRFSFGGRTIIASGILIVAGIFLLTRQWLWEVIEKVVSDYSILARLKGPVAVVRKSTGNLLSFRTLAVTVPLSVVSWAGEGFALFFIFRAMGQELPELVFLAIFAHAFSSIAGALSFLPGGLIVAEGSMTMLFLSASIEKNTAISATFLIRAVTLWFAVILGTVVFISGNKKTDWLCFNDSIGSEPELENN